MARIANADNATITPIDLWLRRAVPERPVLGPHLTLKTRTRRKLAQSSPHVSRTNQVPHIR